MSKSQLETKYLKFQPFKGCMGKLRSPAKLRNIKKVLLIEIAPIAALILSLAILLFVGVIKPHTRLNEFQTYLYKYKFQIWYFVPTCSVVVALSSFAWKKWRSVFLLLPVLSMVAIGISVGSAISPEQNEHLWPTDRSGPNSLMDIVLAHPTAKTRSGYGNYIQLDEFLDGKVVKVPSEFITSQGMDSKTLGFYLDSFANAKVEIDHSYDPLIVPFSNMTSKEIIFEGSSDSPKFLIFGNADSYHYFSNKETNYLVADQ